MFNDQLIRKFYITSLSAIGFFLPLSIWLLTLFIIIIILVWFADNGIKRIQELTGSKKAIFISIIAYFVYIIWMINTSNITKGALELKIKLPLLIFPLVIGLSKPLNRYEMKLVISFFIAGVVTSSIAGLAINYGPSSSVVKETREISVFVSHIRLALMTDMAIFASVWYFISGYKTKGAKKYIFLIAAAWLTLFLFILLSLTGIIIFFVILYITIIYFVFSSHTTILRYAVLSISLICLFLVSLYIRNEIRSFYNPGNTYPFPPEQKTANGNPYQHFIERKDIENGHLVWLYISEKELRTGWTKRSSFKYDSIDKKGQELRFTLIRYLTSMGFTKDSVGIASLSDRDINNIEEGITNKLFTEWKPIKSKIYELIWQIDNFRNGGNPSGHSVTQRIEYLKTGWKIFKRNLIFGTGTGDLPDEYKLQYERDNSILRPQYRHLAHNQYLTILASLGIVGFVMMSLSLLVPVFLSKNYRSYLFIVFIITIVLSMFGEDTLETHTGISFFAYFYSLFIFGIAGSEG
jgi:hypothetical protein